MSSKFNNCNNQNQQQNQNQNQNQQQNQQQKQQRKEQREQRLQQRKISVSENWISICSVWERIMIFIKKWVHIL